MYFPYPHTSDRYCLGISFLLVRLNNETCWTCSNTVTTCISSLDLIGMRGLCNGLGPAVFGLLFWLSNVHLSENEQEEGIGGLSAAAAEATVTTGTFNASVSPSVGTQAAPHEVSPPALSTFLFPPHLCAAIFYYSPFLPWFPLFLLFHHLSTSPFTTSLPPFLSVLSPYSPWLPFFLFALPPFLLFFPHPFSFPPSLPSLPPSPLLSLPAA